MGEGNDLTDTKYIRDKGPKNITKFFCKVEKARFVYDDCIVSHLFYFQF